MSQKTRQELLEILRIQYKDANLEQKKELLDNFVQSTQYHRKYAIALLTAEPKTNEPRQRARVYTKEITEALVRLWEASNYVCGKRLVAFIRIALPSMEEDGDLMLTDEVRGLLLKMSPATIDRHLAEKRRRRPKSISLTKAGSVLRQHIATRTFAEWTDMEPGFLEIDTVGHCGGNPSGVFCHTLTLADVSTGWTELFALNGKTEEQVIDALQKSLGRLPFPLKGIDSDNGTEFMNHALIQWAEDRRITFTKSRPYKKNDQCYVEQKNGSVVRKLTGHERYTGLKAARILDQLYELARLYVNYFQPSMKLISRYREGGKVKKKYDAPKTPFERLCSYGLTRKQEREHLSVLKSLNPATLLSQIRTLQRALLKQVPKLKDPDALFSPPKERSSYFVGTAFAIRKYIQTVPHGQTFMLKDLAEYGRPGTIRMAVNRLEKKGFVERHAPGLYYRKDKTVTNEEMSLIRIEKPTPKLLSNG